MQIVYSMLILSTDVHKSLSYLKIVVKFQGNLIGIYRYMYILVQVNLNV